MSVTRPLFQNESKELVKKIQTLQKKPLFYTNTLEDQYLVIECYKFIKDSFSIFVDPPLDDYDQLDSQIKKVLDFLEDKPDQPISFHGNKITKRFAVLEMTIKDLTEQMDDNYTNVIEQLMRIFYSYALQKNDPRLYKYSDVLAELLNKIYQNPFEFSIKEDITRLLLAHKNWGQFHALVKQALFESELPYLATTEITEADISKLLYPTQKDIYRDIKEKIDLAHILFSTSHENLGLKIYEHVLFEIYPPQKDHQYLIWHIDYLMLAKNANVKTRESFLKFAESLPPPKDKALREMMRKKLYHLVNQFGSPQEQENILQIALKYCTSSEIEAIKLIHIKLCIIQDRDYFFTHHAFMLKLETLVDYAERKPKFTLARPGFFFKMYLSILANMAERELFYFDHTSNHRLIVRFLNVIHEVARLESESLAKEFKLLQNRIEKLIDHKYKYQLSDQYILEHATTYSENCKSVITGLQQQSLSTIPNDFTAPPLENKNDIFETHYRKMTQELINTLTDDEVSLFKHLNKMAKTAKLTHCNFTTIYLTPLSTLISFGDDIESNRQKQIIVSALNKKIKILISPASDKEGLSDELVELATSSSDPIEALLYLISMSTLMADFNTTSKFGDILTHKSVKKFLENEQLRLLFLQSSLFVALQNIIHIFDPAHKKSKKDNVAPIMLSVSVMANTYSDMLENHTQTLKDKSVDLKNFIEQHVTFLLSMIAAYSRIDLTDDAESLAIKDHIATLTVTLSEFVNNRQDIIVALSTNHHLHSNFISKILEVSFKATLLGMHLRRVPLNQNIIDKYASTINLVNALKFLSESDKLSLLSHYNFMSKVLIYYKEFELAKPVFESMAQFGNLRVRISEILRAIDEHHHKIKTTLKNSAKAFSAIKECKDELHSKSKEVAQLKNIIVELSSLLENVDTLSGNLIITAIKEIKELQKTLEARPEPEPEVTAKPRIRRDEIEPEIIHLDVEKPPALETKIDHEAEKIRELNKKARELKSHERYMTLFHTHLKDQTMQTRIEDGKADKETILNNLSKQLEEQKNAEDILKAKEEALKKEQELRAAQERLKDKIDTYTLPTLEELRQATKPLPNDTLFNQARLKQIPEPVGVKTSTVNTPVCKVIFRL